jgi:hypothetical protein
MAVGAVGVEVVVVTVVDAICVGCVGGKVGMLEFELAAGAIAGLVAAIATPLITRPTAAVAIRIRSFIRALLKE